MILTVLQIAATVIVAFSLVRWRLSLRCRNAESWESLVARLHRDWSGRPLTDYFLAKEGLSAPPEEIWERMHGPRGLWAMYRNAGVMLEMADYAARNCASLDCELLASIRSDALQVRIGALTALAQCALNKAGEGLRFNAFKVASQYTGMAARMAQLLEDKASGLVPDFVAAM